MFKSLQSFLHGVARAFTLPKSVRQAIAANPLAEEAKVALQAEVPAAISAAVSAHVADPAAAAALTAGISHVVEATGLLK